MVGKELEAKFQSVPADAASSCHYFKPDAGVRNPRNGLFAHFFDGTSCQTIISSRNEPENFSDFPRNSRGVVWGWEGVGCSQNYETPMTTIPVTLPIFFAWVAAGHAERKGQRNEGQGNETTDSFGQIPMPKHYFATFFPAIPASSRLFPLIPAFSGNEGPNHLSRCVAAVAVIWSSAFFLVFPHFSAFFRITPTAAEIRPSLAGRYALQSVAASSSDFVGDSC